MLSNIIYKRKNKDFIHLAHVYAIRRLNIVILSLKNFYESISNNNFCI